MKARLVAGILASLLVFAAAPADAASKRRPAKHAPKTAAAATSGGATKPAAAKATVKKLKKPALAAPLDRAAAKGDGGGAKSAAAPKLSRFLASGVPLTEVREGRFKGVGSTKQPCGTKARWAKAKTRWRALDAWGQVAGTLTVGGSERYEGTGCHQVWFSEGTGHDGRGVFVSEGSGYAPGASAEWKADAESRRRFDRLYSAQEGAWTEGKAEGAQGRRTLFFTLPAQESADDVTPTQRRAVRWAVSGGRVLLVGYAAATGAWKVAHVLPPNGKANAYEPLAVLDMNGDGLPEIVVHEEAGGVFTDRVLSFDPAAMRWETAIESPGGASR